MNKLLGVLLLITLTGCYEDRKREEFKQAGCTYFYTEELAERKYCGKACSRHVKREWFTCPSKTDIPYRVYFDY